ncbi:MAG: ATP-binding cassette domain-containing protein [Clostridiales bacterium]|jgi:ABC-2 type transport system ATP-binding protein|nr:ATP-binding cassette domain-containing protein [Clostridiales bacterium]
MSAIIEARELEKSFRVKGKSKTVEAVRGVTLSVSEGEIYAFLGPNGAGKTTFQRMLTTLLPIDGGTAIIAGFDMKRKPGEVRKHIGYVSQIGGADLPATGRENLLLAGQLYGMKRRDVEQKIHELTGLLEIDELLDRIVRTYSGGQKRRLEIALGILHEPEILFMDEPTTGLDPQNRANLWAHIKALKERGMTVFLTTHYLDEADELADRLAIIDYGQIVTEGAPKELKKQISGDVIQLRLKNGGALPQELLSGLDFVNETRTDGETVILYVGDGAKALPIIFDLLKKRSLEAEAVSLLQPSLDDVFLKQTGRSLRDTGKGESK